VTSAADGDAEAPPRVPEGFGEDDVARPPGDEDRDEDRGEDGDEDGDAVSRRTLGEPDGAVEPPVDGPAATEGPGEVGTVPLSGSGPVKVVPSAQSRGRGCSMLPTGGAAADGAADRPDGSECEPKEQPASRTAVPPTVQANRHALPDMGHHSSVRTVRPPPGPQQTVSCPSAPFSGHTCPAGPARTVSRAAPTGALSEGSPTLRV
jgi:hypothetical protein